MTESNRPRRDRIEVHGLKFLGYHGVYDEERRDGNQFRVDVEVEVDTREAGSSDALPDTVDYRGIAQAVLDVGKGPSQHLIESLADDMASLILERLPVHAVEIKLRKYAQGVPGEPEWVGLTIRRQRETT